MRDHECKWISGSPEAPVSGIARESIRTRLDAVWYYAPLAAKHAEDDVEYVHQLRVSVRRARAVLDLYGGLLPRGKTRATEKLLNQLRKAAGDARDLDVLAVSLRGADGVRRPPVDAFMKEVARYRRKAQAPLVASYRKAKRKEFKRLARKLKEATRWRDESVEPRFDQYAGASFRPLLVSFFSAASAELSDVRALHKMRIRGKRVRYAMELLCDAFDPTFREQLYPVFSDVQSRIGTINDHATAISLFAKWRGRSERSAEKTLLDELMKREAEHLESTRQQFVAWWTTERAEKLAVQFQMALKTGPGSQGKP